MSATITYGPNGFSPANVTVAEGGTVTWVNESGTDMWVASDPHPLHDGYDGTPRSQHCAANYTGPAPFDSCKVTQSNDSFSFVFTKTGSWGYHDHFQEDNGGTVTVVARQ
jgi:plastocyanin